MVVRRCVTVIDDDESVRESLPDLLVELGFRAVCFASPEAFLASGLVAETECLILDINMPGISGPELHDKLKRLGLSIPIIFITARKEEAERARMVSQGAVDCLFKPFSDTALSEALQAAFQV